jgi:hypothetical protein
MKKIYLLTLSVFLLNSVAFGLESNSSFCPYGRLVSGTLATDLATTTNTQVIAAQGAGVRVYLYSIIVTNNSASVATIVKVNDGSTARARFNAAIASGASANFNLAPLVGSENTAWNVQAETNASSIQATFVGCAVRNDNL